MTTDAPPLQLLPDGDVTRDLTPDDIVAACDGLRDRSRQLAGLSTVKIADGLGRVAAAWLEDADRWLVPTARDTAAVTGYTPEMVEWALRDLLRRLTPRALVALVENELGDREPFQQPRSRAGVPGARGAVPARLTLEVLAGTVPAVAIEAIALSLLARSPLLLKTSRREPVVARRFVHAIRELAPELAPFVSVVTWDGGDVALERAACEAADVVVAWGGDEAIDAISQQCRFPTRFFGYGHRVSFGVIDRGTAAHERMSLHDVAHGLALDVAAYDQRGCMSPHCVFVARSAPWSMDAIAQKIVDEALPQVAETLPRGTLEPDVGAAFMQAIGVAEFDGRAHHNAFGAVIMHTETRFVPSPGGRLIHLVPFETPDEVFAALRPLRDAISTVGLITTPAERGTWLSGLSALGARRFTRPGRMQRPLWLRDHDGRPRIGDRVEWVSVEPS